MSEEKREGQLLTDLALKSVEICSGSKKGCIFERCFQNGCLSPAREEKGNDFGTGKI